MSTFAPNVDAADGGMRRGLRILIADDSEMVRKGIIAILQCHARWDVCGEAADGVDAIEKAKSLRPDVILLDISMPSKNGLEAALMIRQELREAKILVVTLNDPAMTLPSARAAGADGCVGKDRLTTDLVAAIEEFESEQADGRSQPTFG
jgi:two-component system nitrate/nitrite response regulator NarL